MEHKGQQPPAPDDRRQAALRTLDALRDDGDRIGSSALARASRRARAHFLGHDAGAPDDAIEIWGRRIGRALSLAAVIGLSIYLYLTYVQ